MERGKGKGKGSMTMAYLREKFTYLPSKNINDRGGFYYLDKVKSWIEEKRRKISFLG